MNVKEKVGVLGLRPASAGYVESHGAAGSLRYAPSSAASASAAFSVTGASAASSGTKAERQAAALQLWSRWAHETLGPMSADPSPEELTRKSARVQRLENECAALAARAQRRLEVSSAIRGRSILIGASRDGGSAGAFGGGGGGGSVTGRSSYAGGAAGAGAGAGFAASEGGGSTGVLLRPGSFNRELQYAVRERRRAAAYTAVRAEGAAEAGALAAADAAAAAAVHGSSGIAPSLKSRAMLDALIASRAAGSGGAAAAPQAALAGGGGGGGSPQSAGPRLRPHSAHPLRSSTGSVAGGGAAAAGRLRPRSAVPGAGAGTSLGRQTSIAASSVGSVTGGGAFARAGSMAQRAAGLAGGGGAAAAAAAAGLISVPEGEYLALRQEMESVSERLAATQAALEVQADTEAQLREAVELMRARLHSAGLREVDAQRRLAQHSKLEPLFDRLAECFTFNSPEEVVARLEFLEDDKLGTFDQLLRTQEEVTRLQQRLAEVHKAGEMVATRLTTEHLQGSARMQEQNEQLRQELEAMENLVHRLTSRQAQLVALQTAVLQLWGKLSEDPQFAEAFVTGPSGAATIAARARAASASAGKSTPLANALLSSHGGADDPTGVVASAAAAAAAGSGSIQPEDPLSMLHMIEEFVTAKSNKLSIRHFTDIQRIADHVWQQHFRNRADIRGRVVPTFEQLSRMADRMAGRVRSVQDQAGRSQEAERGLMKEVRRLQQQKRALEVALARRDEQFKSIMGVPRRERPASAAAELGRVMRREAAAAFNVTGSGGAAGGGGGGTPPGAPASRAMSTLSLSPAGPGRGSGGRGEFAPLDTSFSITSGLSTAPQLKPHAAAAAAAGQQQRLQPHSQRPLRPASASAPSRTVSSSRLRPGTAAAAAPPPSASASSSAAAGVSLGGTLAAVLSPAVALQVPQMVNDMPAGAHWRQHHLRPASATAAQRTAPMRIPAGSLFYAGSPATAAAPDATGAGAVPAPSPQGEAEVVAAAPPAEAEAEGVPTVRWSAPQRSAIEQAFLTRLERRTRVT
ncbi:hypothetical protein PLESTB_001335600 [Pleodorina starrii]|uniref:Uncharacterized protein n=1 Tax=Pleodorina starrii TaxID=330485 RepID=A0A9W6F6L7_9CHLO|nr:hypothetical protein PLESTB_001335600 [Pleodorina starrii]